jgi:ArsR family transcriptional regulator
MRKLARFFQALSDETRLRILNVIIQRECCVCEVVQALQISETRASRNLSVLCDAGFLKARREGLWVLYSIDNENLKENYPHLLSSISNELKSNPLAVQDLVRLSLAKRTGLGCTPKKLSASPAR